VSHPHPVRSVALLCLLSATAATLGGQAMPVKVREFGSEILKNAQAKGAVTNPTVITTTEELAKVFTDPEVRKSLNSSVDFTKEQMLYFGWAGSGTDRLTFAVEKNEQGRAEVVFKYRRGATDDVQSHYHLYGLPKGTPWRVAMTD
jgi:hypothetical protein